MYQNTYNDEFTSRNLVTQIFATSANRETITQQVK